MMSNEAAVTVVLFIHSLLTVVWVGGMVTLGIAVIPASRSALGRGPQMMRLMAAVQSRLRWFVYIAIVGLAVSGVFLSRQSPDFRGFFAWGDTYAVALSLKHALMIVMVAVALVRSLALRIPVPAAGIAARPSDAAATGPVGSPAAPAVPVPSGRVRASMALLYGNIGLGVTVLFLSALTTAVA